MDDGRAGKDWIEWHAAYAGDTPLSHRLIAVKGHIHEALLERPAGPIRVISVCAGDGRDLFETLIDHPRRADVGGRLVELDPELAATAAADAPSGIDVVRADAGSTDAYIGAVPADLLLVCGVFGNIDEPDIERTIRSLPMLCARGAVVIWTRHRRAPDLTVDIRRWFAATGFEQVAFDAPEAFQWSVGVHRLVVDPSPFLPGQHVFSFVTPGSG